MASFSFFVLPTTSRSKLRALILFALILEAILLASLFFFLISFVAVVSSSSSSFSFGPPNLTGHFFLRQRSRVEGCTFNLAPLPI